MDEISLKPEAIKECLVPGKVFIPSKKEMLTHASKCRHFFYFKILSCMIQYNMKKEFFKKRIILYVSVIGAVFSIFAGIFVLTNLLSSRQLKIEVITHSVECLTESLKSEQSEPRLKTEYYFDGKQIDNLWKVGVTFRNNSSETLVGKGELKKIIDKLRPCFPVTRWYTNNRYKKIPRRF